MERNHKDTQENWFHTYETIWQHIVLRNREGQRITIPRHDPVGKGLLLEIISEAGITREEFLKLR